ncbi:MAG: nucleoside kinase [Candidatus Cryptobacteroides sp.]
MIRIFCTNTGTSREFQEGASLLEISEGFGFDEPFRILAAKVNNVAQGLRFRAYHNLNVEFVDYKAYIGREFYCRSLCLLLHKAAGDIFPGSTLTIKRPISKGYFCDLVKADGTPTEEKDADAIRSRMEELVALNMPIRRHELQTDEAIRIFRKNGREDTAKLLETSGDVYTTCYSLDGTMDYYYDELVPFTGYLKVFGLIPYEHGLLLRVPDRHNPTELAPMYHQPKTFEVFKEASIWNSFMDLANVGDVNEQILSGNASDLIRIAEALQEKKIVRIAEEIEKRHSDRENPVQLVLITGPSSSGKSTFCKRLSTQLKACGLHPVSFSTDDYFVNRVDTPLLPDGSYDFDNFETVDYRCLQSDLLKLLGGEEVDVPQYNFVTGEKEYHGKKKKLGERSVVLLEGIHALNPRLTDKVPEQKKYKIFINAITSISLDSHNCIPTSDNRLLRRIVRDYLKGAFSVRESIANWPNVRRAEVKWIYPFQEEADVLFNSTYLVEFAALRSKAERILSTVPKNCSEYTEAARLLKFLHCFLPVSDKDIPATSLIRSFIG